MIRSALFLLLSCLGLSLWGQSEESTPVGRGFMMSADLTQRGYGLSLSWLRQAPTHTWTFGLDAHLVKDSRESMIDPFFGEQGRRYVYGKLNHLVVFQPSVGVLYDLMPHGPLNQTEVKLGLKLGPALGVISPYYLEIFKPNPTTPFVGNREVEAYDPAVHSFGRIVGRANLLSSQLDPRLRVGASLKAYMLLDFSAGSHAISGLQLGVNMDLFPQPVPIMAEIGPIRNPRVYLAGSVGILFGSKW